MGSGKLSGKLNESLTKCWWGIWDELVSQTRGGGAGKDLITPSYFMLWKPGSVLAGWTTWPGFLSFLAYLPYSNNFMQ